MPGYILLLFAASALFAGAENVQIGEKESDMEETLVSGNVGLFLQGLKNTLVLVSLSLSLGMLLAVPLAILRTRGHVAARVPVRAFIWFFKGTPLLVQMLLLYCGLAQVEAIKSTFLWPMFKEAYFCALFVFCLNTCVHTTIILAGSIRATPYDAIAEGRLAGMSTLRLLKKVILPQALRQISTYSKEMVFMLHGCVLTSVIVIFDISGAARIINSLYYSLYQVLFSAAALYLTITLSVVLFLRMLKNRWNERCDPGEGVGSMEIST